MIQAEAPEPMTPQSEAAIWRQIGEMFEQLAESDDLGRPDESPDRAGLCFAAARCGLPSYCQDGRRVDGRDDHGPTAADVYLQLYREIRAAAAHRALTAYLIAEMIDTGDAHAYNKR